MRSVFSILVTAAMIAATLIVGCAPLLKSAKPGTSQEQITQPQRNSTGQTPSTQSPVPGKPPPPATSPPSRKPAPAKPAPPALSAEALERERIDKSALEFAKGIPNVEHVKTCYSKMFGGWYLHLYVKKGKKISKQHYTWNPVTKEWEVSLVVREVPLKNLEQDLKTQVEDEKCSVLK